MTDGVTPLARIFQTRRGTCLGLYFQTVFLQRNTVLARLVSLANLVVATYIMARI